MYEFTCKCSHEFDYQDSEDKFNLTPGEVICPMCGSNIDDKTIAEHYTKPKKDTPLELLKKYNEYLEDNVSYMQTGIKEAHVVDFLEQYNAK